MLYLKHTWIYDIKVDFDYTCDKTGHQQRKHQHLKHSHQQLSWEGEEGHITVGHVVTPQAESQDDTCGEGNRWADTRSDFYENVSQS